MTRPRAPSSRRCRRKSPRRSKSSALSRARDRSAILRTQHTGATRMDYVRLGSSGMKVSRICLGCMSFGSAFNWMVPQDTSFGIVRKALDLGINFFDTANVYSGGESEHILGRALKHFGVKREDAVIATKV